MTVRIKNIETGESQVRTWSGPYITWFDQDGSAHVSFPRRHVLWLFEADEGARTLLHPRPLRELLRRHGGWGPVNVEINGIVTDLCAELS